MGKGDRDNLIAHCFNPSEVLIARTIDRYIAYMQHIRDEQLIEKENTAKKIARGVIRYSVYQFEAEFLEKGERVTKTVELKCEVIKKGKNRPCEYPYALKIL